MSDAPERTFVQWPHVNGAGLAFSCQSRPPARRTEYIRADIHAAEIAALQARAEAAEAALARALPTTAAERDVLTERSRQIIAEGWDARHDDNHTAGELSIAAACYALLSAGWSRVALLRIWPKLWGGNWLKDCDQRRAKVKAAALLIADIERLDRALPVPADLAKRLGVSHE